MKHHTRQNKLTNRRTNILKTLDNRIILKEDMD